MTSTKKPNAEMKKTLRLVHASGQCAQQNTNCSIILNKQLLAWCINEAILKTNFKFNLWRKVTPKTKTELTWINNFSLDSFVYRVKY